MSAKLKPSSPDLGDRLFRVNGPIADLYTVSRFRCIEVRPDGGSRWVLETTDCAGRTEDEAVASRWADNLNRAEPWYDKTLEGA